LTAGAQSHGREGYLT